MSQLRKSASFRSRIPVRRSKVPVRRCCSPPPSSSCSTMMLPPKSKRNPNSNYQNHHHWQDRRYSSTSYSSSDESDESVAPFQKLLNESKQNGMTNMVTVSTDAMSLDGLLDSVSSGSFTDSPSPVDFIKVQHPKRIDHSSYESLDKINYDVETLKLTNDIAIDKQKYLQMETSSIAGDEVGVDGDTNYWMAHTNSPLHHQHFHTPPPPPSYLEGNFNKIDANNKISNELNEIEKQRKLSDWYYIKTSPKPKRQQQQHQQHQQREHHQNRVSPNPVVELREKLPAPYDSCNIYENHEIAMISSSENGAVEKNLSPYPHPHQHHNNHRITFPDKSPITRRPFCHHAGNNKTVHNHQQPQHQQQQQHHHHHQRPHAENVLLHHCDNGRFGEVSSSSFEHVNIPSTKFPEKMLLFGLDNNVTRTAGGGGGGGGGGYENVGIVMEQEFQKQLQYNAAKTRPLPRVPTDDDYGLYPPKSSSFRTECDLSGSYVSLECPSPPGPPACLSEPSRDPQSRLGRCLRTLYTELALREPIIPPWAPPVAPGATCPAKLEPELRLHVQSHGFNESISVDQLLTPIQTKEGPFLEAPRRILIECPPWATRSALALRILHAWAKEPPWPTRGTPVALAVFIPFAEMKGSLSNFISKELLPKGPLNPFASGFGGFNAAWNSLESLKAKLLFVIDGYDPPRGSPKSRKGKTTPQDIVDLLEGRLFPESRIITISITQNCSELLPLMQRHVTYEGLTWGRSASLLGGGQWGAPSRLLDTVQECVHLRNMVRTPLGCLAIAAIYEITGGDLPSDEIDAIESMINCVAADNCPTNISELGRLALFCLKAKRPGVTTAEIRMYCSAMEAPILNCLDKGHLFGKTAKRKLEHSYTPICPGVAEYLAANYLASLVNRPGLMAAEIAGLPMGDDIDSEILKVLTFAMSLLGGRAHVLLSTLTTLWLSPQTIFTLALAGGESEMNLNALCDLLGISKIPPVSPLESKSIWVQIKSTPNELNGWGLALKGPTCTLKNLELIYQIEKHMLLESRNGMDVFLEALACNESVTHLRISSLIENDIRENDISHLAVCVAKALQKPRLESFELNLTLLEEDPAVLKLQPVVTALCRSIPRQPRLSYLLLDLGLCTSQLVQICTTLEKCSHVTRLSLPHLRCERGAIGALASLLTTRPLASLALPACWGARDDPPSSSGVSMGSGSGSSSGTSGLIKQSSLTGAPSPRSYPPGLFSSLPRGVMAPTSNMGRSATLPRQPIEPPADKRSSDSVVSRTWYPTPACDGGPHNSGTLHDLLLAARETYSKLHGLDLSKAQLSLEDSMCLGETVRLSTSLHSLKLEGASRLSEILPSIIGAGESTCLQMISLGSPRLALEDGAITMSARALSSCPTLRLLSIEGWSFRIENSATLSSVRAFLTFTSARELGLSNCRLHLPAYKNEITMSSQAYECRSVVVLKLAGAQVILADHLPLKGPQILPFLHGFPFLRDLDLSAPARSSFGSSTSAPLILGDKCILTFFQNLHLQFNLLNTLKICNWMIHLDEAAKTLKTISKLLKNSPLSHVKTDGLSIIDRPKKSRIEPQFFHTLISSLPSLRWMGMSLAGMKENQITAIGNAVLEFKGHEIDIRLSESTIENARVMTQSLGLDGKFDIKVSTFGTSSGILIHVEKSGVKSLTRRK